MRPTNVLLHSKAVALSMLHKCGLSQWSETRVGLERARLEENSNMLVCSVESVAKWKLLSASYVYPLGLCWWSCTASLVGLSWEMCTLLGSNHVKPKHEPKGQQIQAVNVLNVPKAPSQPNRWCPLMPSLFQLLHTFTPLLSSNMLYAML